MKGTLSVQRLKRAIAVAGVSALVLGGAVLGTALSTTQAHAATGTVGQGSGLTLSPATGAAGSAATTKPTFSSAACPAGHNGSAALLAVDPTTPSGTAPGGTNGSQVTAVIAPANATFTGTWGQTLASLEGATAGNNINAGVQFEVADICYSDAAGTLNPVFGPSTFVTIAADGSFTANQTFVGAPQSVNLTLTASPNPATSGQSVTLTATASVNGATGTVTFTNGTTSLGTAALSGGTPSTATLQFTAPTETTTTNVSLTATLTSPGTGFTAGTAGTFSLPVQPPPVNPVSATGTIPLAVNVPLSGTFTLSVNSTTYVVLGVNTAGTTGTAATTPIVVTDTYNSYPGWSVTGEATQWTGVTTPLPTGYPAGTYDIPADHGSQHIAADQLGWQPTNTGTLPTGVTLGGAITAGTTGTGLGDGFQSLATGAPGVGSFTGAGGVTLGANLTLAIPAGQEEGPYASVLNIDAMSGTP